MSQSLIDGLKELLRTVLLSLLPVLIVQLQSPNLTGTAIVISGTIAVLKGLDEWLTQKSVGVRGQGITGF